MAKRRSSASGFRTTAPKENTAIVSILIFIVGIIGWVASISFISPLTAFVLVALAYVVLLLGVLVKNL